MFLVRWLWLVFVNPSFVDVVCVCGLVLVVVVVGCWSLRVVRWSVCSLLVVCYSVLVGCCVVIGMRYVLLIL